MIPELRGGFLVLCLLSIKFGTTSSAIVPAARSAPFSSVNDLKLPDYVYYPDTHSLNIGKNSSLVAEDGAKDVVSDVVGYEGAATEVDPHSMAEGRQRMRRRRRNRTKNFTIMGSVTSVAMLAQLFLGKVVLIAGAAFLMAKIALFVSLLSSVKKCLTCSNHGAKEHVVVSSGGHGYGSEGWQRRTQQGSYNLL